jgi:hypothetical protein
MLKERILETVPVKVSDNVVQVSVRMPWYRALPLSCVTGVSLTVDGEEVPADTIRWVLSDQRYTLSELADRWDTWWYVLDSATVEGAVTAELGDTADVQVKIGLLLPYIPAGDGFLQIVEPDQKTLDVERVR